MDISVYVNMKKEFHENILNFLESEEDSSFSFFTNFIDTHKIFEDKDEILEIFRLLLSISNNHHRCFSFFDKIGEIIIYLLNLINPALQNSDIFDLFLENKLILLFLFKNNIVKMDKYIFDTIFDKREANGNKYRHFFYPELKLFNDDNKNKIIEREFSQFDPQIKDNFEEKRQIGENESYICELIRKDSIQEFVSYISMSNIPLSSIIKPSIFETNQFLIEKQDVSLIEYAAFFGSMQIIQYLLINGITLPPSSWKCAIHSQNADLIHFLEEKHVLPTDQTFGECYKEAIKCHHNNIANYIESNLLTSVPRNDISFRFQYYNYEFIPDDLSNNSILGYFVLYDYVPFVYLLLKARKWNLNEKIIYFFVFLVYIILLLFIFFI